MQRRCLKLRSNLSFATLSSLCIFKWIFVLFRTTIISEFNFQTTITFQEQLRISNLKGLKWYNQISFPLIRSKSISIHHSKRFGFYNCFASSRTIFTKAGLKVLLNRERSSRTGTVSKGGDLPFGHCSISRLAHNKGNNTKIF